MTTLLIIILALIAIVLTVWFIVVPAEVVAGTFKAFRDRSWRNRRRDRPQ